MDIKNNILKLQENTKAYEYTLIAATKYVDSNVMIDLYNNGISNFGENRVDSFLEKHNTLSCYNIIWHFIGALQTNKVKLIINDIDYLHSLDRISLAKAIQKYSLKTINCFIQVNISNEINKQGISLDEIYKFIEELNGYDRINIVGLMGMAMATDDMDVQSLMFKKLNTLKDDIINDKSNSINSLYLSMGMSNDYLCALQNGSTHIRIGSLLFK